MILYIGTYTEILVDGFGGHAKGIYCYNFDSENGELEYRNTTPTRNPSYLSIDHKQRTLYAVEEAFMANNPKIHAFKIHKDHSLTHLNEQNVPGGLPCHLTSVGNGIVLVAGYESGHVAGFNTSEVGKLQPCSFVIQHKGKSIHPDRQQEAHAHMIARDLTSSQIAVCDLGLDKVLFYKLLHEAGKIRLIIDHAVQIPAGNGPRHIAFHPNGRFAFVMNELRASISLLEKKENQWQALGLYSALPGNNQQNAAGSAIRIHPSGQFVYGANRGTNSISIFYFNREKKSLQVKDHHFTGGATPRDFILSPDGRWLLAGHQDSDSIMIYQIHSETGLLEKKQEYQVTSPVCFQWFS